MPDDAAWLSLAEMLAARLCDEAGAALGNGSGPRVGLAGRLHLLRAAWGGRAGAADAAMLRRLGEGLPPGVTLDLAGLPADWSAPPAAARVLINLLLLAAEALPNGGTVALAEAGPARLMLRPQGAGAAWPAGFAALLAAPDPGQAPGRAGVPAAFAVLFARQAGLRLAFALAAAENVPPLILHLA